MEQCYDSNFYIAAMQMVTDLGSARIRELIKAYGEPYAAWKSLQDKKKLKELIDLPSNKINKIAEQSSDEHLHKLYEDLENQHITYITYRDILFPSRLQEIYNPPVVLFCRGNINLLKDNMFKIAMVGARKCTDYGRSVARHLGKELSAYDVAIVSGGARGIDSYSHEGTLAGNGRPIVVLGCGLDIVYPPENKAFFDKVIANRGLLVSEYAPGTPPCAVHFPQRNRIIGGLANVVIVVEARASSGSLITADMANNEGREVYVVPGNILSHVAEGNHWLLRQGATVLTKAGDIVEDYDLLPRIVDTEENNMLSCKLEPETVLDTLSTDVCITVGDIIKKTGIPLQRLQSILLDLEMKHCIEKVPSRGYIKLIGSEPSVH